MRASRKWWMISIVGVQNRSNKSAHPRRLDPTCASNSVLSCSADQNSSPPDDDDDDSHALSCPKLTSLSPSSVAASCRLERTPPWSLKRLSFPSPCNCSQGHHCRHLSVAMAALAVLPSASLCIRCQASSTSTREPYNSSQISSSPEGTPAMNAVTGAVNALFSFKPFFKFASGQARKMIIERGTEIGYPWAPELARLREYNWDAELKAVQNPDIEYPEYYLKPFHAYDNGNLSWDAALEVELAAKSVHANVFDPEKKVMDPNGDVKLRDSYHAKLLQMLNFTPRAIVDLGCASGLSTFGLHQVFPNAHVIGVDLSPYFVSVANFRVKQKTESLEQKLPVHFLHAAGEYTGLPSGAFDLVSMCLVCHELPRSATKEILEEAHRLLRPGGALSIMEMNPYSPLVQNMVKNVFAFTAFKATEPYFDDYRTFYLERAIEKRGFMFPTQTESSPRHRTLVAIKK